MAECGHCECCVELARVREMYRIVCEERDDLLRQRDEREISIQGDIAYLLADQNAHDAAVAAAKKIIGEDSTRCVYPLCRIGVILCEFHLALAALGKLSKEGLLVMDERPTDPVEPICQDRDSGETNRIASYTSGVARSAGEVGVTQKKSGGAVSASPALDLDFGRRCLKCRKAGAMPNGYCLRCGKIGLMAYLQKAIRPWWTT